MPWAKLDDRFHSNPKVRRVWRKNPAAVGLYTLALSYNAGELLDGQVAPEFVEDQIPNARQRQAAVTALVEAGLWLEHAGGWEIKDYLKFNPSRARVLEKRDRAQAAGRLGGYAKAAGNV